MTLKILKHIQDFLHSDCVNCKAILTATQQGGGGGGGAKLEQPEQTFYLFWPNANYYFSYKIGILLINIVNKSWLSENFYLCYSHIPY